MSPSSRKRSGLTIEDFCAAMERIAPTSLAQSWDNVGLLAGDVSARVKRVLLTIDLTRGVLNEARRKKVDLLLAYHPPIFKPITSIRAPGIDMGALVFECLRDNIAIYSTHTALDAAEGGTNDVMAELCGVGQTEPLEYVDQPGDGEFKLVTFLPEKDVDRVADAIFKAGAGTIGDYTRCSYRIPGEGTFYGGESTNPALGRKGRFQRVREIRIESVVCSRDLSRVVAALRHAHPYDEPAFDLYPLAARPVRGIGRVGPLPKATTLGGLARKLKRATRAPAVQIVGKATTKLSRAIIVVGAAGSLPFQLDLGKRDVIVTGEIRHHDALTIQRTGCSAITLGHCCSERPALKPLAARLKKELSGVAVGVSTADASPFATV